MNTKIIIMKLKDIKPYEKNPRKNNKAVDAVAESIKEFGFQNPIIVDKNNVIIAGHTRYKAAKKLNIKDVPVIVAENLNEEQANAYRLIDNKTNELAEWDDTLLFEELLNIENIDMSLFGFDLDIEEDEKEIIEDEIPEVDEQNEPITKLGNIWQLGNHRLMCGDSSKKEDVEKLMNGDKADMVFTDPPYNIGYQGVKDKRTIKNDKMGDADFIDFLSKSLMVVDTAYICCSWQYCHLFKTALENIGMPPKAMIIWNKVNPAQHLDKYFKQHEIIYYYGLFGGEKTLRGDIWECKRQKNTVHPTMKPIELIAMALQDQPNKKVVYDGFGGSGSTLIACEQLNRVCYMMELDPKYCDVIVKRWETLTGKEAVLINE